MSMAIWKKYFSIVLAPLFMLPTLSVLVCSFLAAFAWFVPSQSDAISSVFFAVSLISNGYGSYYGWQDITSYRVPKKGEILRILKLVQYSYNTLVTRKGPTQKYIDLIVLSMGFGICLIVGLLISVVNVLLFLSLSPSSAQQLEWFIFVQAVGAFALSSIGAVFNLKVCKSEF